ncbi:glycoside hydrolase family 2 TIM barrel-domain containing protein [Paenibacillus humicola]|uniref:glycoside hydrolase family 2 TIM barrel-domain containing protein n=1 Tax=Paenibacillus humicola TaxID=3110540 RepID=UPI00237AB562|nr:glycoside hydrolase family 2 TIM barrel-domain containing protein [Paenibacillus humicola]
MKAERQADPVRVTERFDFGWRFLLGDAEGAGQEHFDDSAWRTLDLPHDWSVEGEFSADHPAGGDGAYLPAGIGWYRKRFILPEHSNGRHVEVRFDGVYMNSEVWINGHYLGKRPNGYIGFHYDLTPYLHSDGRSNTLAVRADNSEQPGSRWYTGSGIYRHVWLIRTGAARLDNWGVHVTTPDVSASLGTAKVTVNVVNELGTGRYASLRTDIVDADGTVAASKTAGAFLPDLGTYAMSVDLQVNDPKLWSEVSPYLYTLRTSLYIDDRLADEMETPFGFRAIAFDADRGFMVNGARVKLNGVCLHHDGGCVGAAVPERVWERRLQLLKEMGCNAIRMSHNPPSPELLDLCDRMGFFVMDEAFDEWTHSKAKSGSAAYGYYKYFDEWWERDLTDMLRRDRNHPSIIMWSVGNEIPEQSQPAGPGLLKRLMDVCRREDPTRPVTLACDNIGSDINAATDEFLELLDVVGYNYVNRWRGRTETFYAEDRVRYPQMKMIGSEHSSVRSTRADYRLSGPLTADTRSDEAAAWRNPTYYTGMIRAERLWKFTRMHDYVAGDFMWTGIDYLGEARWPNKSSSAGVIDLCGFPKDGYYFYKSQWTAEPMIHPFPHWNWEGREGQIIPVLCYTNCDTVELFVNGKSFGVKSCEFPLQGMTKRYGHYDKPFVHATTSDLHLAWDVPYEPGVLRFVGTRDGKEVCVAERETTGTPVRLELETDRGTLAADGTDAAHVTVRLTDARGRLVPAADCSVSFSVQGAGTLIGVDNGDPASRESFKSNTRKTYGGLCLAIVQAGLHPGTVVIRAEAEGLEAAEATVRVQ